MVQAFGAHGQGGHRIQLYKELCYLLSQYTYLSNTDRVFLLEMAFLQWMIFQRVCIYATSPSYTVSDLPNGQLIHMIFPYSFKLSINLSQN